jgi:hypothetical protein
MLLHAYANDQRWLMIQHLMVAFISSCDKLKQIEPIKQQNHLLHRGSTFELYRGSTQISGASMCGIKMTFFFYQTKVPFHKKAQLASG